MVKKSCFFESNEWKLLSTRLRWLCARIGRRQEADDIVQQYALDLMRGKSQYQPLDYWLIDYSRKRKWTSRNKTAPILQALTENDLGFVEGSEYKELVISFAEKLKTPERVMFLLTWLHDFNQVEVGELFNISASRVSQRLSKIYREIRCKN